MAGGLGELGEKLAQKYFTYKGYKIIGKNIRIGHKEIDLIVSRGKKLIFVEVKTRSSDFFGRPEEQVTTAKLRHLEQAMGIYLRTHQKWSAAEIDVISITMPDDIDLQPTLKHFKNVSSADLAR